jgi:hypothetical protein
VAGGACVADMKNQNGVEIRLHATTRGLDFNASLDGVSVHLEQGATTPN